MLVTMIEDRSFLSGCKSYVNETRGRGTFIRFVYTCYSRFD